VGIVEEGPVRIRDFRWNQKPLKSCNLRQPNIYNNSEDIDKSEYLVKVRWKKTVDATKAKWKSKEDLFTTRLIRVSLVSQTKTLKFIEAEFGIRFKNLIKL
jgi:hypothetical protein